MLMPPVENCCFACGSQVRESFGKCRPEISIGRSSLSPGILGGGAGCCGMLFARRNCGTCFGGRRGGIALDEHDPPVPLENNRQ
jgi:hypothetical protein